MSLCFGTTVSKYDQKPRTLPVPLTMDPEFRKLLLWPTFPDWQGDGGNFSLNSHFYKLCIKPIDYVELYWFVELSSKIYDCSCSSECPVIHGYFLLLWTFMVALATMLHSAYEVDLLCFFFFAQQEGLVYAVEFSHRSGRDLINVAKKRTNIIPVIEDARHPHKYRMLIGKMDVKTLHMCKYYPKFDWVGHPSRKWQCVSCLMNLATWAEKILMNRLNCRRMEFLLAWNCWSF